MGKDLANDAAGRIAVAGHASRARHHERDLLYQPAVLPEKQAGLPPGGVHIFRHSAAKLRRDAGESVEDVSRFLDHSSLAVTTTYLRRLEGQEDRSWTKVAEAIGI